MECFDPFKDYLELSFLRRDMIEEESPVPEIHQDSSTNTGWLNIGSSTDWNSSDGPGQWTPGSSSGESAGARPLLGRRDSVDDVPNQQNSLEPHSSSSQAMGKRLSSGAGTALLSDMAGVAWGQDCGAWTDTIGEVNCVQTTSRNGKTVEWSQDSGAWTDLNGEINGARTTLCNRNQQAVAGNSGLYCSTGFFGGSDTSHDAGNITRYRGQALGENLDVATSYPRYSNGFNVEYPDAISHVALLLNKLMQQGGASVAEKNCFRNFSSLDEGKFCAFCKKNRERREFYTTHVVKDSWGKVICPILRKYVCPNCGATGDNAHTLRHCPIRATADLSLQHSQN